MLAAAARGLLGLGPAAVLVTDGPSPVRIVTARRRAVGARAAGGRSLDTVGAGDAFVAACLVGWSEAGMRREDLGDPDALAEVADAAVRVAAAACTVSGANLPARLSPGPPAGQAANNCSSVWRMTPASASIPVQCRMPMTPWLTSMPSPSSTVAPRCLGVAQQAGPRRVGDDVGDDHARADALGLDLEPSVDVGEEADRAWR